MAANNSQPAGALLFLRRHKLRVVALTISLVIPCLWHRHIEAGDLASHVYNAWLAQLIERGQAPGLFIVHRWNNVLFDVAQLRTANLVGLAAAEKIVVSACVLIFFWGAFAFVSAATDRPPWFLAPCIAMLAYGYSFNMGFMNYYLSLGLACFGIAVLWRARGIDWIAGVVFAALAILAHPIGFLWMIATLSYVKIRARLPGWWKASMPLASLIALLATFWYVAHQPSLNADWDRGPFYLYNGADQLGLYGTRYVAVAFAAFFIGVIFVALDFYQRKRDGSLWKSFELPIELYALAFLATALLPENLRPSQDAGWIGVLGSRLTSISAILGFCVLGCLRPRRWHVAGFGVCAVFFFSFLYQDTAWLNQFERNAENLVNALPPGTRVVVTVVAPADSRIRFVGHAVERACVGHCFSYANYEPASAQFRVRVRMGSPVVSASIDDAEDMSSGTYEMDDADLPMKQIYQCDPNDLAKLCIRDLTAGEINGQTGIKPPSP